MLVSDAMDVEQAKLDPASMFHRPEDVLKADVSPADKKAILLRWEADAEALIRATEEGMPPSDNRRGPGDLLREVQAALLSLDPGRR